MAIQKSGMCLQNGNTKSVLLVLTVSIKMIQLYVPVNLLVIIFVLYLKEEVVALDSGLMISIIIF